jgi:GDP/UDP-N,N'-diacetylbacillosamine 2-epimerase (hydrolysing)
MVKKFVDQNPNACTYTSMGQLLYLSCLSQVDGVVGNSSSGLLEAPSFQKGAINIGDRQRGRLKAKSVIDCEPTRESIKEALTRLYSSEFQASLKKVNNPYDKGGATNKILSSIKTASLQAILKKRFYNQAIV